MQPRFSRPAQTAERYGVSQITIWRWERAGKFPRRMKLGGGHAAGHLLQELDEHDARIAAERDTAGKAS
jgi:predicted DNA-binding transcriptional regulator AlpA